MIEYTFIIFVLGLCMGSFVNAWVWRTHTHKSIVYGRSECPWCHHQLAWYDNVPLVSYLLLRGKCRSCHKPISVQYPLVELALGMLFAGLLWHFQPTSPLLWSQLIIWLVITVLVSAAFVYDLFYMVLPDRFMLPAIVLGLGYVVLLSTKVDHGELWRLAAAGAFAGVYLVLWLVSRGRWIGDGDIRLAVVLGLMLTAAQLIIGVFAGYLVGSAVGIYLLVRGSKKRGDAIPLGPFLIIGLYVGLFWGQQLATWYLHLVY